MTIFAFDAEGPARSLYVTVAIKIAPQNKTGLRYASLAATGNEFTEEQSVVG